MKKSIIIAITVGTLIVGTVAIFLISSRPDTTVTRNDASQTTSEQPYSADSSRLRNSETPGAVLSRDAQRRNDMSRTVSGLAMYQANNRGALPKDYSAFRDEYLLDDGDEFKDPMTGNTYTFASDTTVIPSWENENERGVIFYAQDYACEESGTGIVRNNSSRSIALRIALEAGSNHCINN